MQESVKSICLIGLFLFVAAAAQEPEPYWELRNVLPDFGHDSYGEDAYERSSASRTDIKTVRSGLNLDWLYVEIDCGDSFSGSGDEYAIELDNDPLEESDRGDFLLRVGGCDDLVDSAWVKGKNVGKLCGDDQRPEAFKDKKNDVGWEQPAVSEFPISGNGYEKGEQKKADKKSYFRVVGGNLQIAVTRKDFKADENTRIRAWVYQGDYVEEDEFYFHDARADGDISGIDNLCGVGTLKWIAASVSFDSYGDSLAEEQVDNFPGDEGSYVYVSGANYSVGAPYGVAFYDASGNLVGIDSCSSDSNSVLIAAHQFGSSGVRSESLPWHACVYFVGRPIPSTYLNVDVNRATVDSFYVFGGFDFVITLAERDTANEDISITWASVSGRKYEVLFSNSLQGSYQVAEVVEASDTFSFWADDGSSTGDHPSDVIARFYKVKLERGPISRNTVGKMTRHLTSEMSLVSVPLVPYSLSIQDVISTQLTGAPDEGYADRVWEWNAPTQSYNHAWLVAGVGEPFDGKWWDSREFRESEMELPPGRGFWIQSRNGEQSVTFVGQVFDDSSLVIEIGYPMQLVGSCYPDTVRLVDSELREDGATGRPSELTADRVWLWDESQRVYDYAWLVDSVGPDFDGKWWDSDPWGETSITLRPGVGYWFQLRNETFTWTYPKPYAEPPNR